MLEKAIELFGNHHRLSKHLGVSPSTVYRWRDGECDIPHAMQMVLKGYVEHPERVGQDIAARIKDKKQ